MVSHSFYNSADVGGKKKERLNEILVSMVASILGQPRLCCKGYSCPGQTGVL